MNDHTHIHGLANRIMALAGALDLILCDAFGVDRVDQIKIRFLDHIPHAEVVVPLMRVVGGPWLKLLVEIEAFTAEQKAKLPGAGAGVELSKEKP
jgi:hypothetical protein